MGKSKDKDSEETLRGMYRELLVENKRLRRELARYRKAEKLHEHTILEYADAIKDDDNRVTVPISPKGTSCPKCSIIMNEIDCVIKTVYNCPKCNHRFTGPAKSK